MTIHSTLNEEIILETRSTETVIDIIFFAHLAIFETARITSDTKQDCMARTIIGTTDTNAVKNNSNILKRTPQEENNHNNNANDRRKECKLSSSKSTSMSDNN